MRKIPMVLLVGTMLPVFGVASEFRIGDCIVQHVGSLPEEKVRQIVESNLTNESSIQDCLRSTITIEREIRQEGAFAARVYPERVEGSEKLKLSIMEGRLAENGISLSGGISRVNDELILDQLIDILEPGSPLMASRYERAILLTNDIPGIGGSSSTLFPGDNVGEAKFQMTPVESKLVEGNVYLDNFGSVYTGENRIGATVNINSPFKVGDKFTLGANATNEDTYFVYLDASLPVWLSGMRTGITVDALDYHTDEPNDFRGNSQLLEAYLSYPVLRSRQTNVYSEMRVSRESMEDKNNTSKVTDREVNSVKLTLNGDHIDHWYGGGTNSFHFDTVVGDLDLDGYKPYAEEDAMTAQTAGHFLLLNWQLSRLQHISGPWQSQVLLAGQIASKRLDGSQSISFGGPYDFPGYHSGEIMGDEGIRLHWDIRYNMMLHQLGGHQQVSAFYDIGRLKTHAKDIVGGLIVPGVDEEWYTLQSAGLGFSQIWTKVQIQGALGWQIDNQISDELLDGDPSEDFRAWIQLVYNY